MKIFSTSRRKPLPQLTVWGRFSFLVNLGWLAILVMVAFNVFKNWKYTSSALSERVKFHYFSNFGSPLDTKFWQSLPIVKLGQTCLYPNQHSWVSNAFTLPLLRRTSFCDGQTSPFRGSALKARVKLRVPFEVTARLKANSSPTAVSAFFTYTDPNEGTPHYENDFEFPGGQFGRTGVWTNNFSPLTHPTKGDPKFIPLSFDPSATFADYKLVVERHKTSWYVNDLLVRERENEEVFVPPQEIVLNAWQSSEWGGLYDFTFYRPSSAQFTIILIMASELS